LKIDIDVTDIVNELNLPKNSSELIVSNAVEAVTGELFRNWRLEASNNLRKSRNDYINGLQVIDNTMFSKTIRLNGKLNNMIEKGADPYDMKIGFSKSNKRKFSTKVDPKTGRVTTSWYLTIPFRQGVPTTIGDSSAFTGIMPSEIYKVMKNKKSGEGLKKTQISSPYDIPSSRAEIKIPTKNISIPEYKHKHSIFEGLTKQTAAYGKTTQNSYVSFRRVSSNSDPNSWISKGIKARDLLTKARNRTDIDLIVENSVDLTLSDLGYGE
jgi:hypothetical protein